jgi:hypothetical protein
VDAIMMKENMQTLAYAAHKKSIEESLYFLVHKKSDILVPVSEQV